MKKPLSDQLVTAARIHIKRAGIKVATNSIILTFETADLDGSIHNEIKRGQVC